MRLRFLLLSSALLLGTLSCRSASSNDTPPAPMPESQPTNPEPMGSATDATLPQGQESADAAIPASAGQDAPAGQDPSDAERLRLIQERQRVLAAEYIRIGDQALAAADLEGALRQFSNALDVMPSSMEARDRLHKVEALMGNRFAQASDFIRDSQDAEVVRRAQARLSAEAARERGDAAMRAGEYDQAVQHYREAQLVLRYHPLIATQTLDEQLVTGMLEQAVKLSAEAERTRLESARNEAEAAKREKERAQREYRENKLQSLYNQANEAFLIENYERAEALMDQVLLEDPGNQSAEKLRAAAQLARHNKRDETTRRNYREQWKRTFDELDTLDVPQTDAIVFDSRRWKEVSMRDPLEFVGTRGAEAAETQAILDRLESVRFTVKFIGPDGKGSPLSEVAQFLQTLTGVNFIVTNKVTTDLDEEALTIRLDLPERSVKTVLDMIPETSENLRWKIEDGVVKFVTKEEMLGGQVMRMYAVQDMIHPVPSFAGREINVSPSGGIDAPDEADTPKEGGPVTSDKLEGLIRNNIAPASWNDDPKNSLRIADNGTMVVYQTPDVQAQIKALLDDLREATGIMVDIQARFLTVQDNFLEDIGLDFRGLGQPGLGTNNFFNDFGGQGTQSDLGKEIGQGTDLGAFYDDGNDGDQRARTEHLYDIALGDQDILTNSGGLAATWTYLNDLQLGMVLRAVSKSERVELVTAPRLLVFNTARANIAVLNQVAYVKDFDVEIAQAASIADPIIDVVQDGVVLDVRPVVSADRRFVLMELRPTVATLKRPIRQQTTTLGSQNSVAIELPEVDIQRVRTTVPMPDGGTVLLGGLKVSEKQDMRSGIPIVNKIPVVRFLFERKGSYVSNRKLLILIKANIVIPQESEPTAAQLGAR
ncbi:MAG TPA: hypothetical protein VM509_09505 [Planctomycetota bacterium]|nr:hypothetical protein [Planctomycetota bacterium]